MEASLAKDYHNRPIPKNDIVAVFVVQFDVHKGNVIEWQYPQDSDLNGIEYQAICSGLHKIERDTVYFYREGLYGLSVFNNVKANVKRGAYMKAVGVLVRPFESTDAGDISSHLPFLQNEISKHMDISATDDLDKYEALKQYYEEHQYESTEASAPAATMDHESAATNTSHTVNHSLQEIFQGEGTLNIYSQTHLSNFLDLTDCFGPDLFILWKAALLKKRIILITYPPMENSCRYVHSICQMGQTSRRFQRCSTERIKPLFSVGVNDIPYLEKTNYGFIACTPDSIYQMKTNLYDLAVTIPSVDTDPTSRPESSQTAATTATAAFVYRNKFSSSTAALQTHNAADFIRYRILWQSIRKQAKRSWKQIAENEPKDVLNVVKALTTSLFYWLYEQPSTNSAAHPKMRWLELFAGSKRDRREDAANTGLLLESDDEDAAEIDNSNLLEVVAGASHKDTAQQQSDQLIKSFFETLNNLLLEKLQSILSINEEDGLRLIPLYPKDLVHLGLDPIADATFVTELSRLYFAKEVHVYGLQDIAYIRPCCGRACCSHSESGVLRI